MKDSLLLVFILWITIVQAQFEDEQWVPMPDGKLYHIECVHQYDEEFKIQIDQDQTTLQFDAHQIIHSPCPHKPITIGYTYYSSWVAYAQTVHSEGYGQMYSEIIVPTKPSSHGPTGLGSVYLFNGLEDGGGHKGEATLILQPVLQYGKSGCLLNPVNFGQYWLTSYMVNGAGRAYCGKNLGPLQEGEILGANMTLTNKLKGEWLIQSTRFKTKEVSTLTVSLPDIILDAAYLTLEGMVIYNCDQFPTSDQVEFQHNYLSDINGNNLKPNWETIINHSECNQQVEIADSIFIKWNHSLKNKPIN